MTTIEMEKKKTVGIYIHIPFCKSKCPYCDFCSFPRPTESFMMDYVSELCRRMEKEAARYAHVAVDSIYFGGGTPTLLPLSCADALMQTLGKGFCILPHTEITLECNPATADEQTLKTWRSLGVNRLSMGAQSAQPCELKALGRLHTWEDVCRTVDAARRVGIDNINLDFMMGIPQQTVLSLTDTLKKAISLEPQHLSAYCLSLEEGTPYHRRGATALGLPDEDQVAEMYLSSAQVIQEAGYEHYEISNFCRPGYESRHNLNTWQGGEYLGLGVAAHGHMGLTRYGNSRDMEAFLRGEDITVDAYDMTAAQAAAEAVMLGLRLSRGISLKHISQRFGVNLPHLEGDDRLRPYVQRGLLRCEGDRISLTREGWLVSNAILSDIWEILDEFCG